MLSGFSTACIGQCVTGPFDVITGARLHLAICFQLTIKVKIKEQDAIFSA